MYLDYWGLRESPFAGSLDPQLFFESPTHEEALARAHFLVDQRRRAGLLLASCGCGKSLLLRLLAQQLRDENHDVALLSLLGIDAGDLLENLAAEWGLTQGQGSAVLWRRISDHLIENRYQRISTVLLLDDCDEASREVLEQVTRLAQIDLHHDARLTLILAAQPRRLGALGMRLLELAELRIDIAPWQGTDTAGYLRSAVTRAGARTAIFDPPAMERIHEVSGGVPRRVKQLADLCLLAGAGSALRQIDADTVESVYQELGVVAVSR